MLLDPPTGRPIGARIRSALGVMAGALTFLALVPGVAAAQDDAGGAEVKGVLTDTGDDGQKVGVAGVVVTATDAGGAEVGRAETDSEGAWAIQLAPGDYAVGIDVVTLPEGVGLRNPDMTVKTQWTNFGLCDDLCEDVPAWWLLKKKKTMYNLRATYNRALIHYLEVKTMIIKRKRPRL